MIYGSYLIWISIIYTERRRKEFYICMRISCIRKRKEIKRTSWWGKTKNKRNKKKLEGLVFLYMHLLVMLPPKFTTITYLLEGSWSSKRPPRHPRDLIILVFEKRLWILMQQQQQQQRGQRRRRWRRIKTNNFFLLLFLFFKLDL